MVTAVPMDYFVSFLGVFRAFWSFEIEASKVTSEVGVKELILVLRDPL